MLLSADVRLEKLEEAAEDIKAQARNPHMKVWVEPVDKPKPDELQAAVQDIL